ncbi:MAG: ATP phosphoribosyltransferase [Candidatus Margulisbacteria bacterium]|nr:ATP phosphoribosyltransferase [Candidatus Margulisiibacteriota bacterium]
MTNKNVITIGLAKGYLLDDGLKFFKDKGIKVNAYSDRQLIFFDKTGKYRFMILRPLDVPSYVEHGSVDIGITGLDILKENKPKVITLKDLDIGHCRMVIATDARKNFDEFNHGIKVATKFVNCTKEYFNEIGVKADIIKLYGSVELAAVTGLSDVIVDLTASGKTLVENKLKEVRTIFKSTAHLIANNVFYSLNYPFIKSLIE